MYKLIVLVIISALVISGKCDEEDQIISDEQSIHHDPDSLDISRGFGDEIKWIKFKKAVEMNANSFLPMMVIIHKSWCGACQNLKPKLQDSLKFKELSEHFIMVNTEDNDEPDDPSYAPDGSYIPRILFVDPTGRVRSDIINELGNPQYRYFYSNAEQVVTAMENALAMFYEEFYKEGDDDHEDTETHDLETDEAQDDASSRDEL